jgi:hypothetical protein
MTAMVHMVICNIRTGYPAAVLCRSTAQASQGKRETKQLPTSCQPVANATPGPSWQGVATTAAAQLKTFDKHLQAPAARVASSAVIRNTSQQHH